MQAMFYFLMGVVMFPVIALNANSKDYGPLSYVSLFLLFLFWGLCIVEIFNVFVSRL